MVEARPRQLEDHAPLRRFGPPPSPGDAERGTHRALVVDRWQRETLVPAVPAGRIVVPGDAASGTDGDDPPQDRPPAGKDRDEYRRRSDTFLPMSGPTDVGAAAGRVFARLARVTPDDSLLNGMHAHCVQARPGAPDGAPPGGMSPGGNREGLSGRWLAGRNRLGAAGSGLSRGLAEQGLARAARVATPEAPAGNAEAAASKRSERPAAAEAGVVGRRRCRQADRQTRNDPGEIPQNVAFPARGVLRAPIPHARRPGAGRTGQSQFTPGPIRPAQPVDMLVASEASTIASGGGGLADRYAAALYSYADDNHALDAVVSEMEHLGRVIDASADFRRLLESPLIDVKTGTAAALAVLKQEGFGKPVQDFVGVISSNRRLRDLREIVTAFAALVAHRRGIVTAHVISAHPLNDVQRQQLRARLIEAGYGNVNILEKVEPDLLGGLVVRIGARLYDTSLKSRLQRLQYAMKGAA